MNTLDSDVIADEYPRTEAKSRVYAASTYLDDVWDEIYGEKATGGMRMPWSNLDWFSFRSDEITIWSGYNGHGKSNVLGQIMLSGMNQGFKVCIASMEMKPSATIARMSRQALRTGKPSREQLDWFHQWLSDKLWIFDHVGSIPWTRVLNVVRHSAEEYGVNHFIIDSVMKCGIAPDDYSAESQFVDELCALAQQYGIHIHLVHHGRKPPQGGENKRMSKYDIRGTGQTTDKADNVIIVSRNKLKEREARYPEEDRDPDVMRQPDAWLTIDKQRHGTGEEGDFSLYFDREAGSYSSKRGSGPIHLISNEELKDVA